MVAGPAGKLYDHPGKGGLTGTSHLSIVDSRRHTTFIFWRTCLVWSQ